jgi:hypothetical protein
VAVPTSLLKEMRQTVSITSLDNIFRPKYSLFGMMLLYVQEYHVIVPEFVHIIKICQSNSHFLTKITSSPKYIVGGFEWLTKQTIYLAISTLDPFSLTGQLA